jgi:hypothetical protein
MVPLSPVEPLPAAPVAESVAAVEPTVVAVADEVIEPPAEPSPPLLPQAATNMVPAHDNPASAARIGFRMAAG